MNEHSDRFKAQHMPTASDMEPNYCFWGEKERQKSDLPNPGQNPTPTKELEKCSCKKKSDKSLTFWSWLLLKYSSRKSDIVKISRESGLWAASAKKKIARLRCIDYSFSLSRFGNICKLLAVAASVFLLKRFRSNWHFYQPLGSEISQKCNRRRMNCTQTIGGLH